MAYLFYKALNENFGWGLSNKDVINYPDFYNSLKFESLKDGKQIM